MHRKKPGFSKKMPGKGRHKRWHIHKKSPWFSELMGRRGNRLERGETRYLILDTLAEKGRHGYDIMQSIQEKTGGLYRPSPGTVYPTLQMLEDLKFISSRVEGNRKIYELTATGREELGEQSPLLEDIYEDLGQDQFLEKNEFFEETHDQIMKMFKLISRSFHRGRLDSVRTSKIKEIIQEAVRRVDEILKGE
ncbi:MAG: helix-turn-helix transcriptional regulator [Deltaproteobacteria bacterium]|nr:helix-turn-helix transcriptional regulator [Deltaproteobacteria bacterium]